MVLLAENLCACPKPAIQARKPLAWDFEGLRYARRGDYRFIYEILEHRRAVVIHRVQHRREVYRPS